MLFPRLALILAAGTVLLGHYAPLAHAGGGMSGSGGGNSLLTEDNPWFVGLDRVVGYCVEADAANFSVALPEAKCQIRLALQDWTDHLRSFGLTGTDLRDVSGEAKYLRLEFREDCSERGELHFYLGVMNASTKAATNRQTIGITVPTRLDPRARTKQGFIWISPDQGPEMYAGETSFDQLGAHAPGFWRLDRRLYNVLIHEIGHLFVGSRHIEHTPMAEEAPKNYVAGQPRFQGRQLKISSRFLLQPDWASLEHGASCGKVDDEGAQGDLAKLLPGTESARRFCVYMTEHTFIIDFLDDAGHSLNHVFAEQLVDRLKSKSTPFAISLYGVYYFPDQPQVPTSVHFAKIRANYSFTGLAQTGDQMIPLNLYSAYPSSGLNFLWLDFYLGGKYVVRQLSLDPPVEF